MTAVAPSRISVVARVGVAQLIGYAGSYYMPAIIAGPVGRDLGISPTWTFAGLSCGLIVSSFMGPAVGQWVDHGGARRALVAANIVFAAGLAMLAAAHGLALMIAAWIVMGVGMGLGFYETAFAALTRLYGVSARNLISGVTLIAGFTSTVTWPLTAWIEGHWGWRAACLVFAAANLLIALPLNLLMPSDTAPEPARRPQAGEAPAPAADTPMRRAMIAIAVMFAATSFVSSGMSAIMPTLLERFGAAPAAAIAAAALVGPSQIVGRLAEIGWLRRMHPAIAARASTLFLPIGVAVLVVGGVGYAALFVVLYGLGNGILTISRGTLPLAIFGPAGYGRRIGILSAPARVSGALAPLLLGLLVERYGAVGLYVAAGLNIVGFAALLFIAAKPRA